MNKQRETMIREQLRTRGINNTSVIEAIRSVPRDRFLDDDVKPYAYDDTPLRIAHQQTISQPYMVAYMTEALAIKKSDTVLEIGTGSGYQTAILAELAKHVYTIERIADLSRQAQALLTELDYQNITYIIADGTKGYEQSAPYDKIIVTAAPKKVPEAFLTQLAKDGKCIIPVGGSFIQDLMLYEKQGDTIQENNLGGCRFVPLVTDA